MTSPVAPTYVFTCSICGELSEKLCVVCTKDTCGNHLCAKCQCCSDCCLCDTGTVRR